MPTWHHPERSARLPGEMPLVGRDEELAYLREVRQARPTLGVVVAGAMGVGKSRLVTEAVAGARSERWSIERVDGATAAAAVPLSAVAHLAPPEAVTAGDPLRLMVAVSDQLTKRARQHLVLLVDDGHLLDEASVAVLRRVATLPNLFLLVTVRSDEPVPAPIVGLWKEGLAHRIELQPLSRDEVYRLASGALGSAEPETLQRLWNHSLGNPLFLRELLLAESGDDRSPRKDTPREVAGNGRRLAEVVQSRVGSLDGEQRQALEIVSVAGPLGLDVLTRIVPEREVDRLVQRGLLTVREEEPQPLVTLAHPVYGLVLGEDLTASRTRSLRSQLLAHLEQLESDGTLGPRDAVRLVTLRLDLGVRVGAPELLAAVRYVSAAYPRAVAERLAAGWPVIDGATAALASGDVAAVPSQDDLVVAERLARQAWESDGGLAAGLALIALLVAGKKPAEAAELVDILEAQAETEADRTQVALSKAALEYWVLGDADRAEEILLAAEARATERVGLARLRRLRAGVALNVGRVTDSIALAQSLFPDMSGTGSEGVSPSDVDPEAVMAAATAAAGLALRGQADEAMELVSQFLPAAQSQVAEQPEVLAQLLLARIFAARVLGRLDEAEWLAYACYRPAVENGSTVGMAIFTGALGQVALDKGQPATAVRRLREAEILLRQRDTFGYRPFVLAGLAVGLAQLGEVESADEAWALASAGAEQPRYFDAEIQLALAWVRAADGRMAEAASTAMAAADQARASDLRAFEAGALHAAVRFGHPDRAAVRLRELAETTGSPLMAGFADHAAACVAGDAQALADVSVAFEKLGAHLLAAEAAGQAAAEHNRADRRREASRAASRVDALGDRIESVHSPSLRLAARPPTLTAREHEVALLAVDGLTSREIADRLFVSTRTVESHLYRAFAKLGVSDRGELAELLVP